MVPKKYGGDPIIVAGLDVGAITIKSVVLKDDKIVGYNLANTGMKPGEESKTLLEKNLQKRNLKLEDVDLIIATGHGRHSLDFARQKKSEITCNAKGAKRLDDKARMVVDIGGQGIRVIELDENGDVSCCQNL